MKFLVWYNNLRWLFEQCWLSRGHFFGFWRRCGGFMDMRTLFTDACVGRVLLKKFYFASVAHRLCH
jgi:hypothetical protein